jgi:hypothetical protein
VSAAEAAIFPGRGIPALFILGIQAELGTCGGILKGMMRKTAAIVQILIILLIVGFGTYHLYQGNFEVSIATMPLLLVYYVFVVGLRKKEKGSND